MALCHSVPVIQVLGDFSHKFAYTLIRPSVRPRSSSLPPSLPPSLGGLIAHIQKCDICAPARPRARPVIFQRRRGAEETSFNDRRDRHEFYAVTSAKTPSKARERIEVEKLFLSRKLVRSEVGRGNWRALAEAETFFCQRSL